MVYEDKDPILQTMVSGISPAYWALEPECQILTSCLCGLSGPYLCLCGLLGP